MALMNRYYQATKARVERLKHHWLTIAFALGFVVDNITLNQVDQLFDNFLLASYVALAMAGLLLLYASTADKLPESIGPFCRKYSPLLIQYAFGGLLSGMLIFYGRSGSWLESWPFLLSILLVIAGNETIKNRAPRLIFNVAMLFIGIFSYAVLIVPILIGTMGEWVFIGSGLLALAIMYAFIRILRMIVPRFVELNLRAIVFTVGMIYVSMNFLYFTNIIRYFC